MLGIPNTRILRSVTKYGLADVTIDFRDGVDIYWARQQVGERLAGISASLPPGVAGGMAPVTTPLGEMFMFTVEGGGLSLAERRSLLDWVIRPALRTVPGVADVNALGGAVRAFEVVPNPLALAAAGISLAQLQEALRANNRNDGAGRLGEGDEVLLVRSEGSITSLDDLRAVVVAVKDGAPVRIGTLAEVRIGALTRYGVVTKSARQRQITQGEAVEGLVLGLAGTNARDVVDGVRARLAELQPALPPGVTLNVFYDRSAMVKQAVGAVAASLLEATVIVLVLPGLFLGNVRAALTVALVLPLAALVTFILMRVFHLSANLMSLGGLAIAIGMLVDAAVVVVENIVQRLATDRSGGRLPRVHVVYRAVREVGAPVTSGILIIITVFLPLLTLQDLEGKFFAPVALAIVFALAGSLVLSLTVIPVLASYLIRDASHAEPWLPRMLLARYAPVLAWAMRRQRVVAIGAGVMLLCAAAIYPRVGKTFMPTMDEGELIVGIEKLASVSLEQSAALDLKIQHALLASVPEVTGVVGRAGSDEIGLDPMGLNQTDNFLQLAPRGTWRKGGKDALVREVRKVLDALPGIEYSFSQPIELRVSEMIIGVRGDIAVKIYGPGLAQLGSLASQVEAVLKTIRGNQDVYTVQNDGVQYLRVVIDRLQAGRLGLSVEEVQDALRVQIEGQPAGSAIEGNRRTPIVMRADEAMRLSPAAFAAVRITGKDGVTVPLSGVAQLTRVQGPVKIDREMGSRGRSRDRQRHRTRPGRLRRRSQGRGGGQGGAAHRLPHQLGRPVREPAARGEPPRGRGSGGPGADFPAAVFHLPLGTPGIADPCDRPVRTRRRHRRAVARGRLPVGARVGRVHCTAGHYRSERGRARQLFQPVRRCRHGAGRRRRARRAAPPASRDDDGVDHGAGPHSAAFCQRARLGDPAAAGNRRHRRPDHRHGADAAALARPVPALCLRAQPHQGEHPCLMSA